MKLKRPNPHTVLFTAIVVGTITVAGLAGILSYQTIVDWARDEYDDFAPLFAVIVDVGTVVFALATFYKVIKSHPKWGVRLATHITAGLSILFNALSGNSFESIAKHAAAPLLLVMAVETLLGIVWRRQQEIAPRLDRIRRVRWLLAPFSTLVIWRRMALWEVTSYSVALEIDRERIKSRMKLMQQAGTRYWFRVPSDRRVELKLRLLELAKNHAATVPAAGSGPVPGTVSPVPAVTPRVPAAPVRPRPPVPPAGSRTALPRPAVEPVEPSGPVSDDEILEALEQMYNADPRDPGRPFKNQGDIAKRLRVRKARVSEVNQARRAAAEAAATSTPSS